MVASPRRGQRLTQGIVDISTVNSLRRFWFGHFSSPGAQFIRVHFLRIICTDDTLVIKRDKEVVADYFRPRLSPTLSGFALCGEHVLSLPDGGCWEKILPCGGGSQLFHVRNVTTRDASEKISPREGFIRRVAALVSDW